MSVWASQKKLSYVLLIAAVLIVVGVGFYFYFKPAATCSDQKQNQGELEVDCGGPCLTVCSGEVTDLVTRWSRFFRVREGVYTAVSVIENPNRFGASVMNYSFKLYDKNNILIKEVRGRTFVNPSEVLAVIEPSINVGNRRPSRILFQIESISPWQRQTRLEKPAFEIKNKNITLLSTPSLSLDLVNNSLSEVFDIYVIAVVLDFDGNAVGGSSTFIESLARGQSKNLTFTWPEAGLPERPASLIFVRTDLTQSQ